MKTLRPFLLLPLLALLFWGCGPQTPPTELPTFTEQGHLRVVIERPAGTNHRVGYDPLTKSFHVPEAEQARTTFNFLPYPANYGFIPSTRSGSDPAGPLPTLLLAESLPTAFSMAAKPLALLQLKRPQGDRYCLLTIPAAADRRLMPDSTLAQLQLAHPAVQEILTLWLLHHQPEDSVLAVRWQDEEEALRWVRTHSQP